MLILEVGGSGLLCALSVALLAVEDVGAGDLVLAAAHQRQFDLVLDILDMHGSAVGIAAGEGIHDLAREILDGSVDAR